MLTWAVLGVLLVPPAVALLVVARRQHSAVLLPVYAASLPFGSGLAVPGIPVPYGSVSSIAGVLLAVTVAMQLLRRSAPEMTVPAAPAVFLLLLALAVLSYAWSVDPEKTRSTLPVLTFLVVLYGMLRLSPVDTATVRRTENGMIVGGLAVAVVGAVFVLGGAMPAAGAGDERLGRSLIDPNHSAAALLLPLVIAADRLARSETSRARLRDSVTVLAILAAVILTGSRGGLLASLVALLVLAAVRRNSSRLFARGAALGAVLVLLFAATPLTTPTRLFTTDSSGRTDIWQVGLAACRAHCLTGSGWGTFGEVYAATLPGVQDARVNPSKPTFEPHNIWLLVAVEVGVTGVLLLTLGLFLVFREAWRLPSGTRGPPVAAVAGLLVTGVLLSNLEFKYFWMVLTYVGLLTARRAAESRPLEAQALLPLRGGA